MLDIKDKQLRNQNNGRQNIIILLLSLSVLSFFLGASFFIPLPIIAVCSSLLWWRKGFISAKFGRWAVVISVVLIIAMVIDIATLKPYGPILEKGTIDSEWHPV